MRIGNRFFVRRTLLALLFLSAVHARGEPLSAYREHIATPHWSWAGTHAGGTVKALFLVNNLARREPDELAQRFDIEATTLPVGGDPYRNKFDEDRLLQELREAWDVIVVAAKYPWRDLSAAAQSALREKVASGTPMVCFGRGGEFGPPWDKQAVATAVQDQRELLERTLPLGTIWPRRTLSLQAFTYGTGQVVLVSPYDLHFTFFTAFLPHPAPHRDDPTTPEMAYAVAARIVRVAAGKMSPLAVRSVEAPVASPLGEDATVRVQTTAVPAVGDMLCWTLYTPFGERAQAEGVAPLDSGVVDHRVSITPSRAGDLKLQWRLQRGAAVLDFGAVAFPVTSPASLTGPDAPLTLLPAQPARIAWTVTGAAEERDQVQCQVYDPDGRVVALGTSPAARSEMSLPAWPPRYASHTLRVLLLRGAQVLDEQRRALDVRLDRADDLSRYQTVLWGTEKGTSSDAWRYLRLRELGIAAMAVIGCNVDASRMSSEKGMRLVPTNVLVPQDEAARNKASMERLDAYVAGIARYSPLGYSLADEPSGTNVLAWRGLGAEIIRRHDPGARVGYCGTWSMDPDLYAACDYLAPYSPHHLYTPNLWLGVERDVYRSLRRRDGILTCWTHYAPWKDHEPYSRTVPWLWLFEEMNGVSYFQSAQNFAVLPSDLRTTHETRWWSEEVKALQQGIGDQLIGMQRDAGGVRILYEPGARGYETWARALNQSSVSYRLVTAQQVADNGVGDARLLICPDVANVPDEALGAIEQAARSGRTVLATSSFAGRRAGAPAEPARLEGLFGMVRESGSASAEEWAASRELYRGVPVEVRVPGGKGAWTASGKTAGEAGLRVHDGVAVVEYARLGVAPRADAATAPEFVQALFATPAIVRKHHETSAAIFLTFSPDLDTVKTWLPTLLREAGVPPPAETVRVGGELDDTVYLYPFGDEHMRLVGVVQDYERVPPSHQLRGTNSVDTAGYFHHGPLMWDSREAELCLSDPAYLYDVRRGLYLGHADVATFDLQPGRPELFAVLPYRVTDLLLTAPPAAVAGERISLSVRMETQGGKPAEHVVRVTLAGPGGRVTPGDTHNVRLRDGVARLVVLLPHNAVLGGWTVTARDSVTGVISQKPLQVAVPGEVTAHALPAPRVAVERRALAWPEGEWEPYRSSVCATNEVRVSVQSLDRKSIRGKWNLTGGFTLANTLESYTLKYLACNDPSETKTDDLSRIKAPYPPGFGFNRPRAHMWYYNGYLNVSLDEFRATIFALTNITEVATENGGRVDMGWETPVATFRLASVMMPDHAGIFQELSVKPRRPFGKLTVRFSSYPAGFDKDPILTVVDPEHGAWALLGDKVQDRAFGKGLGPGGILILPDRWDSVEFGRGATLTRIVDQGVLDKGQGLKPHGHVPLPTSAELMGGGGSDDVDLDLALDLGLEPEAPPAAEPPDLPEIKARWTLWMFPELSNDAALTYMREHAWETSRRLQEIME